MRRRDFIVGIGNSAAIAVPASLSWPIAVRAQRRQVSVIGYLDGGLPERSRDFIVTAVRRGLAESGYVEGQNLLVEYRWADDHLERLRTLADDLVWRGVAAIITTNTATTLAAKAATKSIPIVFLTGADPVELGLVARLNRPDGNLTGSSILQTATATKRLEIMHELVPSASSIAYLVNPTNTVMADAETKELQDGARTRGLQLLIQNTSDPKEFEAAFASVASERVGGIVIGGDQFFVNHRDLLVAVASRHAVPAIYYTHEFVDAGGLMSYGVRVSDAYRLVGNYTGRILKGEKPADLPVQQSTRIEMVLNLKTAKALGINVPPSILLRADEVIDE